MIPPPRGTMVAVTYGESAQLLHSLKAKSACLRQPRAQAKSVAVIKKLDRQIELDCALTSTAMCYTEHTTRTFGCGGTTGQINIPGAHGIQTVSTTLRFNCQRQKNATAQYEVYCNTILPPALPRSFQEWATWQRVRFCSNRASYFATWITTRQCKSGQNGAGICTTPNTPHLYQNAPGNAPQVFHMFLTPYALMLTKMNSPIPLNLEPRQ
jgi:hypothetical protein